MSSLEQRLLCRESFTFLVCVKHQVRYFNVVLGFYKVMIIQGPTSWDTGPFCAVHPPVGTPFFLRKQFSLKPELDVNKLFPTSKVLYAFLPSFANRFLWILLSTGCHCSVYCTAQLSDYSHCLPVFSSWSACIYFFQLQYRRLLWSGSAIIWMGIRCCICLLINITLQPRPATKTRLAWERTAVCSFNSTVLFNRTMWN